MTLMMMLMMFGYDGEEIVWDADNDDSLDSKECKARLFNLLDPIFPDVLKGLIVDYASDYQWQCCKCEGVVYFTCRKMMEMFRKDGAVDEVVECIQDSVEAFGRNQLERERCGNNREGVYVLTTAAYMLCPRGCRMSEEDRESDDHPEWELEVKARVSFDFNLNNQRFELEQINDIMIVPNDSPSYLILAGEQKWQH